MRGIRTPNLLLLARNRLGRTLARTGVGMGALSTNRQAAAMSQSPVAPKIHQPLDVHGNLTPKVALDHVVAINDFANLKHFLVGQLGHSPRFGYPYFPHDFISLFRTDPMDVLQRDDDALVSRYVDTGNAGHSYSLLLAPIASKRTTPSPLPGAWHRSTLNLDAGY